MKYVVIILSSLLFLAQLATVQGADSLKAGDVDPKTGKVIKYWAAPMDPKYIRNEPGKSPMGMDLVPVFEQEGGDKLPSSTIRIDPVTIQNMGVRTAPVRRESLSKSLRTLGTITYDETKTYAVNLKFDGWIEKLYVNYVGKSVHKGQKLFEIYSPELVTAQEEYLLAHRQVVSLGSSSYEAVRANATSLLNASKKRLRYWDLSAQQIKQLEDRGKVNKNLTIHSPANGVVIKKSAIEGHFAKAGMHQYDIADLSTVWVDVEVFEYELPYVKVGMTATMELDYLPGKQYLGKVLFIYPYLTKKTRTARMRLAFDNIDGHLKPDMYANVFLQSTIDANALVIPQEAVIDSGVRKLIFLYKGEGKFEPREVELGIEGSNNTFQVINGVEEGDQVVVSAQFMFDSESRLREAIQKMLEAKITPPEDTDLSVDELDMDELSMDGVEDLDMSELKME